MFSPGHEALVDNLGGIVPPRVDVYALLDHGVTARTQRFPRLIPTGLDLGLGLRSMCTGAAVGCHVAFAFAFAFELTCFLEAGFYPAGGDVDGGP